MKKVVLIFALVFGIITLSAQDSSVVNPLSDSGYAEVYYSSEARRQLKILCAETGRTQEDLLREALNDFFKKHQKPTIA